MCLEQIEWEGMEKISFALSRVKFYAVVNTAINTQVSQNLGNFLTS
jgi:hypothetical protein